MVEHLHAEDAALAEELMAHHAVMVSDLERLSADLTGAGATGEPEAKQALEHWVAEVLVPHAEEEERTTYQAAAGLAEGRLLIESMLVEHDLIRRTAGRLAAAVDLVEAATWGRALADVFESHQRKENDLILPLIVGSSEVSLVEVMAGAHGAGHDHHDHHHDHHH